MRMEISSDSKEIMEVIRQTVNDAMVAKDRYVTINILNGNFTSINVYPVSTDEAHWIKVSKGEGRFARDRYRCSECGVTLDFESPYCPICGEKLKMSTPEVKDETR